MNYAHPDVAEVREVPIQGSGAVVAATKLHIPAVRPELIVRAELIDKLTSRGPRTLVLVEAPPGYGKTMLLAEWCSSAAETREFAWLSLDEGDSDPVRFWVGVIDALRTVHPDLGEQALEALGARSIDVGGVALPLLLNELAKLSRETVLVLDDYQVVRSEEVHRLLDLFCEHLPPGMQVAIATRVDPPLSLARLRARGQMTEIRAAELRFDLADAEALLRGTVDVDLERHEVARLHQRTEGWPAGLYLAGLSLRGRADRGRFIESFAGDDRHIVDYLSSEVLGDQPDELRSFLLRTSILDRLCGPLCDAVTGRDDGAEMLESVERRNLFLSPLDTTRTWYRYHRLFGQLLAHELELTEPEAIGDLHRRACEWCREAGLVAEAIHHAAEAGDLDQARDLIASEWNDHFNRGRLATVEQWLESVPEPLTRSDPRLCVAGAWLALDRGRVEDARGWIQSAAAALDEGSDDEVESIWADVGVLRAVQGFKAAELESARLAADEVLERAEEGSFPHTVASLILGVSRFWQGGLADARVVLGAGAEGARATGNDLGRSYALGYLGLVAIETGAVGEGGRLGREAIELSDSPGFREHFVQMIGHLAIARVAKLNGRLEEAEREARRAVELSDRGAGRLEIAAARLALARILHVRGEVDEARSAARDARAALERCPDKGTLAGALASVERGALRPRTAASGPATGDELTDRELAVLRLLPSELSRREIAEALYVSPNTVKTHVKGIYRKLEASSREDAVTRARELGVL
jgi:LuxR family transcriptional regulator, maltose regulon positive regulatory protein